MSDEKKDLLTKYAECDINLQQLMAQEKQLIAQKQSFYNQLQQLESREKQQMSENDQDN